MQDLVHQACTSLTIRVCRNVHGAVFNGSFLECFSMQCQWVLFGMFFNAVRYECLLECFSPACSNMHCVVCNECFFGMFFNLLAEPGGIAGKPKKFTAVKTNPLKVQNASHNVPLYIYPFKSV